MRNESRRVAGRCLAGLLVGAMLATFVPVDPVQAEAATDKDTIANVGGNLRH